MSRLFVALDLDERVRAQVAAQVTMLKRRVGEAGRISWVQPARLHLTLRFLGDVGADRIAPVASAMSERFPVPPFAITLGGLGVFPAAGVPRVLWLGLIEGGAEVIMLRREVDDRLREAGVPPEREVFSPHLTLARFRDRRARRELKDLTLTTPPVEPCAIDRVTLYESRLSSAGPLYTVVAQAPLTS